MKTFLFTSVAVIALVLYTSCSRNNSREEQQAGIATRVTEKPADLSQYSRATFAAGCFWCEEAIFESIQGVAEVISGYAGGRTQNPSYEEVGTGSTGHAETVEVYYDSTVIDYPTLLRVFFASQDPTQVNRQGPDIGTQYRSVIFYRNEVERQLARQYIDRLNNSGQYERPIATEVVPYTTFWPAEEYHQDYIRHHPGDSYVQHESLPRLRRTHERVPDLVRTDWTPPGK